MLGGIKSVCVLVLNHRNDRRCHHSSLGLQKNSWKEERNGLLFYNDLVHYRTKCRSYWQKYTILFNGKQICSSIVFNESQVVSLQVFNIRRELEFCLFRLRTRPAMKCEELRMKTIVYEEVAYLQMTNLSSCLHWDLYAC